MATVLGARWNFCGVTCLAEARYGANPSPTERAAAIVGSLLDEDEP